MVGKELGLTDGGVEGDEVGQTDGEVVGKSEG